MRTFSNSDLKTFEQLVKLTQPALKRVVSSFLRKHYPKVVETKDYVFAEGDIPIALCAHLDTVFLAPPEEIYFDAKKNVMWSPDGLGADDRAGVFAILQIIRAGYKPSVIFTTEEERGGIGAAQLAQLDLPFPGLKYIIQLDRRGAEDCVFYDCDNPEFINYVEQFGFTFNWGSFSDISTLCPAWEVAGVNLSVGYYDEHSEIERLFVGQLMATIEKVKKMLDDAVNIVEKFKYIPSYTSYYHWFKPYDGYSSFGVVKCSCCGRYFMEEEMIPYVKMDKTTGYACSSCIDQLAWCDVCDNAYQKHSPEAPSTGKCPFCIDKKETLGDDTKLFPHPNAV